MSPQPALSWKSRLKAWWEGYDLSALQRQMALRRAQTSRLAANDSIANDKWQLDPIEVVERLWGYGFHTPGGDDHIPTLIKPLALDSTMSVLEVGAGLGGVARLMATQSGAWVTGLEADPQLAAAGMHRSIEKGMEKQAAIHVFDPERVTIDKRYDVVFSKEALFRIKRKNELLEAAVAALKPNGQLLFTDYVLAHSASTGAEITAWRQGEPVGPHPWTVSQYVERLKRMKLDIRISEDISDRHRTMILQAWNRMLAELPKGRLPRESQLDLVDEAELWLRRVAALDGGDLRVYRFHALKAEG
jgi:2-polyprenyl-3-methyl-5-hydroxy-6-metoxy-1,4-benzoquinol methylase